MINVTLNKINSFNITVFFVYALFDRVIFAFFLSVLLLPDPFLGLAALSVSFRPLLYPRLLPLFRFVHLNLVFSVRTHLNDAFPLDVEELEKVNS